MRVVLGRAVLVVCLLSGVGVADAVAATGDLVQKPGAAGCLSVIGFCERGAALDGAQAVTVSPDGTSVYVVSTSDPALSIFDRAGDGTLIQKPGRAGCISDTGAGRCRDGTALDRPESVAVSPDGQSVYVATSESDSVAVFDRAPDGRLAQKPDTAGCISDTGDGPCVDGEALQGAESVTVSPDGQNVYVTSNSAFDAPNSDAVAVFDRAEDGTLTQKPGPAGCISESGDAPCADGRALDGSTSVVVSPDGTSAYVAAILSNAVAVFDRAEDGTLTQKPGPAGCISEFLIGNCEVGTGLEFATSVTVSPDGLSAYVASRIGAVAMFDRTRNGRLIQKPGSAGCISGDGVGCTDGRALGTPNSIALSPDGLSAYVAASTTQAVVVLDRAPNGTLAQKRGTAGCIRDVTGAGRCVVGTALSGTFSVAVSPDGQNAYVASFSSDAVAVFDREPSPPPPLDTAGPLLGALDLSALAARAAR